MTFTLGATTYPYLWTRDLRSALENIRAQGFTSTELMAAPPHIETERGKPTIPELRQLLATVGVRVRSVNLSTLDFNLASPWTEMRLAAVREYLRVIDLAAGIDAPYVVINPGKRHPLVPADARQTVEWSEESIMVLAVRAERVGVQLVIENLPLGFLETAAEVQDFVAQLAHPAVSSLFDAANAHLVENEVDAARLAGGHAVLVHLSDTPRDQWCHDVPGTGTVRFEGVTEALRATSFAGDAILELTVAEPSTAFAASAATLASLGWAA